MGADLKDERNFEARQAWADKLVNSYIHNICKSNVIENEDLLVLNIRNLITILKNPTVDKLLEVRLKGYAQSLIESLSTTLSASNQQKLL